MPLITYGIALILLSIAAVPSLILSRKPNAKELLDKIIPYQGWAGVLFCIWGIWSLIDCITHVSMMGTHIIFTIYWILWLACSIVQIVLGFLLGYNLIVEYVLSKNETAKAKGEQILAKLTPLQGTFGIVGIILGLACIALWLYVRFAYSI